MIPSIEDPRWNKLLTGAEQHEFISLPAGLMFSRLRREIKKDGSREILEKSVKEAHAFFLKYEKILADDITAVFG